MTGNTAWVFFPLVVRSVGIFASIVGILAVSVGDVTDPQRKLDQGYWAMTIVAAIGIVGVVWIMLDGNYWFALAGLTGLVTSVAFVYITQYYTAGSWRPVQELARASRTGPATNIISGFAVGLESTGVTAIIISHRAGPVVLLRHPGGGADARAGQRSTRGLFGTAVATMGMLTTVAYILSMDTFGPITDNAGGIAEFSQAPDEVRHITDVLDGVGNTTKALTKGYAVGRRPWPPSCCSRPTWTRSRVRTGVDQLPGRPVERDGVHRWLPRADADLPVQLAGDPRRGQRRRRRSSRRSADSSASTRASWTGTEKPDYARAVDITASAGLREMIAPGLLAVLYPDRRRPGAQGRGRRPRC